ncbi:MAG: nucleotide exchange factor GrpE, partial [Gemmatimonadota bacterium]
MRRRRPDQRPDEKIGPDAEDAPEMDEGGAARAGPADGAGERATGGALEGLPDAEVLLAELNAALQENEELRDRHLRLAAEFDNFRRRTRAEQDQVRALARAEIVRSVLPTLDDLARWRDIPNESTSVEALDKGLDLILRNLAKALEEHGVMRIEAREAAFDPELHQGVLMAEASSPQEDGTISRVFSEGYRLGDLLVRPAQVEVRSWTGPGDVESNEATGTE